MSDPTQPPCDWTMTSRYCTCGLRIDQPKREGDPDPPPLPACTHREPCPGCGELAVDLPHAEREWARSAWWHRACRPEPEPTDCTMGCPAVCEGCRNYYGAQASEAERARIAADLQANGDACAHNANLQDRPMVVVMWQSLAHGWWQAAKYVRGEPCSAPVAASRAGGSDA